jgi:FtsH-binding integral membrane protein
MMGFGYSGGAAVYRSASQINEAMVRVYNNMFLAVINSMVVSFLISSSPTLMAFFFTGVMKWIVMFAPLMAILVMSFGIQKLNRSQAILALHGFSALMGLSFATIFVVFTVGSIVSAFMGAAVLFGTLSLYGYFTKRDLTSIGQFMFVGLIAIVIASIINIFVGSPVAAMVISALAIIIFLGLTAYDTQNIRQMVSIEGYNGNVEVIGALSLYLNFINIFLSLLQLFGNRND